MAEGAGLDTPAFRRFAAHAAARAAGGARPSAPAADALSPTEDGELLRMAVRHRVAAPVLESLATEASGMERSALLGRAIEMRRLARAQARLTAELSIALSTAGVRHLVLKGAPLALALYGDLAERQSRDVDLLVEPADLSAAHAVLTTHGFQRARAEVKAPADDPVLRRLLKDDPYLREGERLVVELHWRSFHVAAQAPWTFDTLWAGRRFAQVDSVAVPVPPAAHELVYLASHGANHFWFRLKWLQDIARLLWTGNPELFAGAARVARIAGLEAPLEAAVELAGELLGAPRPPVLLGLADRRVVGAICEFCRRSLVLSADQSTGGGAIRQLQVLRYMLQLNRRWRYTAEVLCGVLVSPLDHDRLQLPLAAAALYVPLRPLMLFTRRRSKRGTR